MSNDQSLGDGVDLERVILEYLVSHPHAADSAEGVARWWLGNRAGHFTLTEVGLALKRLVDRQTLRQETLADDTTLYSNNLASPPVRR